MEKVKVKNAELWVEEDILMIRMSGELAGLGLMEISKAATELNKKKPIRYVLVVSDVSSMSLSARKEVFKIYGVHIEKVGLVCNNPVTRAIATFLLKGYKTPMLTKIFSNAEDARVWFREGGK